MLYSGAWQDRRSADCATGGYTASVQRGLRRKLLWPICAVFDKIKALQFAPETSADPRRWSQANDRNS
jgi:hypothetical protein